ncbi:MAG: hypothetical protein ACE5IB_06595 [Candidatus Geothermarchaeales archaeon]
MYKLHREDPSHLLTDLFSAAESLHVNFYEDHLSPDVMRERAKRVREFIEGLKAFLA